MSRSRPPSWSLLYGAVALTAMGTVLLQLSLFRILCVVLGQQKAFLVVSVALCGLGVGGLLSYGITRTGDGFHQRLGICSFAACALILLSITVVFAQRDSIGNFQLALICITSALAFTCAGVIVASVVEEAVPRIHKMYCFAVLGAAAGGLLLIPFLNWFGGPNTALSVTVLFAAAAAILFNLAGVTGGRLASVALGLLFTLVIALNIRYHLLDVTYANGHKLDREEWVRWNSFSRVALATDARSGASLIHIDGNTSAIPNRDWDHLGPEDRRNLLRDAAALPYVLRPEAKVLVIGPGGGIDISRALVSGSQDITAVEINPVIANTIMRKRFSERSHDLFLRPGVHIFVEDAQSFLRRSREHFQVIQANLVNSPAGPFALSEDPLYTLEAFRIYLAHLTDDGLLAFTRPAADAPRIVRLASAALEGLGERETARHFLSARTGANDTLLIARRPFPPADIDHANAAINEAGLKITLRVTPLSTSSAPVSLLSRAFPAAPLAILGILVLAAVSLTRLSGRPDSSITLPYFVFIGIGYVLICLTLVHAFVPFLGRPTDALTVVLLPLLGSSALGGSWSRTIIRGESKRLIVALDANALIAFFFAALLLVFEKTTGFPHALQITTTIVLVLSMGFVMGLPFPAGLNQLGVDKRAWTRGACSVYALSGVFALLIADLQSLIQFDAALIGGVLYLCAALTLTATRFRAPSESAAALRSN